LEQKDSDLHSVQEQLTDACRLVKDAHAEHDHEREDFQAEKEGLLRYLEQAQAGKVEANMKIAELEDQVREVSLFKLVK